MRRAVEMLSPVESGTLKVKGEGGSMWSAPRPIRVWWGKAVYA